MVFKVATYVELWNMTDKTVTGTAEVTHETRYDIPKLERIQKYSLADMTERNQQPSPNKAMAPIGYAPVNSRSSLMNIA